MAICILKMSAGEFKTHCLKLMDIAQKKGEQSSLPKGGGAVAKLVPYTEEPLFLFGFMAGSLDIKDDIVRPVDVR